MPQPPPRKLMTSAQLKSLHSEHVSRLQAKHQQECDLLEDIRTFSRQRSVIEKEYAQSLQKLTNQLLKRDFQAMPDLTAEDGQKHRTAMAVWRVILEETEVMAKKRQLAAETFLELIAEPAKPLKTNKQQCMKKVMPQLTTIQGEVAQTVVEMCKAQKTYNIDESQAYDARAKAGEAEEKLNKKSKGIFQSLAGLQKNYAKLKRRMEMCEAKSTESRNEYILCMSAANAHQTQYFTTDLPHVMEVLDGEVFEYIQQYFAIYGNTAQEISFVESRSFNRIVEQTAMINRSFDLKCFLYTNNVFTNLVQYEFEACLKDKCNRISKDYNAGHILDKEARKWATKIAKDNKVISDLQKQLKSIGTAEDKISQRGSSEAISQDPEARSEEILQKIRQTETAKAKAEARIEALRQGGVEVDEWLASATTDTLATNDDQDLQRTPSHSSIRTSESEQTDDHEPTYTHYDDDDDFGDDTFDVTHDDYIPKEDTSNQYPIKCRSVYEFHAGNPDELDMVENEELEIIADGEGDGWVRAKNSRGVIGFIPENYIVIVGEHADDITPAPPDNLPIDDEYSVDNADVAVVTSPVLSSPSSVVMSPPAAPVVTVTDDAADDFPPPPPPVTPPADTQEVTSYSSGDTEVQQVTNSMENMILPVGDGTWVRAIYDYEGTSIEELSFREGTLIRIIRKDENGIDDGFWEGEANGCVGVFPSLVVQELDEDNNLDFPSPLVSPPDYMPPPPVTITAATPDSEVPPTPIAAANHNTADEQENNGNQATSEQPQASETTVTLHDESYNQQTTNAEAYDSTYDDDGEESFV